MALVRAVTSKLSRRFLLTLLAITVATFSVIYLFSVPLIKQQVFEIERHSSRLILDNVVELASSMYSNVEEYRTQVLDSHQQELRVAVSLTESFIRSRFQDAEKNGIPDADVRQAIFDSLRDVRYGNNDYIWVASFDGKLLSHPDPRFHGNPSIAMLADTEASFLNDIVQKVSRDGEGFYPYRWHRLSQTDMLDKVAFVKSYPDWGIVVGSGVYLDDLEKEVLQRKEKVLSDLRTALQDITLAKTGYLYIFDSQKKMLIHPNSNLDGVQFNSLKNPLTNSSIADELMALADTGKELTYLWDKPEDPDNYSYEKLSLVRYLPGFDWYICSSIYLDELRSSSELLANRLMMLAVLTLLGSLLFALFFVNRITRPLEQLASTAQQVQDGDLSARSGLSGDDEVGTLASSFDGMVQRLEHNIETLDLQVKQRSDELLEAHAHAQRMNAVGQLAGGLAHDFNNLLSIIQGNLLLMQERYPENKGLNAFLEPAIQASRRGSDITHRLLAFSRKQPLQPVTLDVQQLLSETCALLRGSLSSAIQLDYQAAPTDKKVNVDPAHMESALINLALNARDAMPDGGRLHIESALRTLLHPLDGYDEAVPAGDYIEILVSDTGSGFSPDSTKKAFEPFFTTKQDSDNSGLGLSMVYGFVKQSNGYIGIESPPEGGASISVLLPAVTAILASPEKPEKLGDLSSLAGKLLLLVEDNDEVRRVVREQLISLELQVLEATTASEAQDLIEKLPDLDILVSDIRLAGVTEGPKLAEQFYQQQADRTILLISGYTDQLSSDQHREFPLLRKPFDKQALCEALLAAKP